MNPPSAAAAVPVGETPRTLRAGWPTGSVAVSTLSRQDRFSRREPVACFDLVPTYIRTGHYDRRCACLRCPRRSGAQTHPGAAGRRREFGGRDHRCGPREFGISQPAVSQQLKVLRENGFAVVRVGRHPAAVCGGQRAAAGDRRLAGTVPALLVAAPGCAGHRDRPRQAGAAVESHRVRDPRAARSDECPSQLAGRGTRVGYPARQSLPSDASGPTVTSCGSVRERSETDPRDNT